MPVKKSDPGLTLVNEIFYILQLLNDDKHLFTLDVSVFQP